MCRVRHLSHKRGLTAWDDNPGMDGEPAKTTNLFPGGGGMAARMRAHDWSATVLGPAEAWPAALATLVGVALQAAAPMALYWGPDLAILYNDAWGALVGGKHPGALGRPAREVFPEAWQELEPMFARVLAGEGAVEVQDQRLVLDRDGTPDEVFFTYSLNPVLGADGRAAGILNVAQETTARVRAAAGLIEGEECFRSFAENSADGALDRRPRGRPAGVAEPGLRAGLGRPARAGDGRPRTLGLAGAP